MGGHGPMMLGGHRGMGENLASHADGKTDVYPRYRENTLASFQQAVKCGVGFVEFDVQVTRDGVPIIWHDDDVVWGEADHPHRPHVADLTLAQLQALCGKKAAATAHAPSTTSSSSSASTATIASDSASSLSSGEVLFGRPRGTSDDGSVDDEPAPGSLLRLFRDLNTRQRCTMYEPWLCAEDDMIPTLDAVFRTLPPEVGFDIEIKMATGEEVVHTPAEEVDRMLTAILPVVQQHYTTQLKPDGRPRAIMFSSFDPDVCLELRNRQATHPVYYLSGCGLYRHADERRTSIPAALTFAAGAGMRGIVVPASILLKNMDMVATARDSHMELMTYGLENNDLVSLKQQADAGVVAAIVDEVASVTAALGAEAQQQHGAQQAQQQQQAEPVRQEQTVGQAWGAGVTAA